MKKLIVTAALVAATCAYGADEEQLADAAETSAAKAAVVAKPTDKVFFTLPMCRLLEGHGEVCRPLDQEWSPIEEGAFYPLGSRYRTIGENSRMVIQFGPETKDRSCRVTLKGDAAFATRPQPLEAKNRVIELVGGKVKVSMPRNMQEGLFTVAAPGFSAENLAGDSVYEYTRMGDGDSALVGCATGSMIVKGRHFQIGPMNTSDQVLIRTTSSNLVSIISGKAGDFNVKLDIGLEAEFDPDSGKEKPVQKYYDWKMSPLTAVRIFRMVPSVGEDMGVTIITFDANGEKKDRFWFAEKHYEVTGSERPAPSGEDAEALAKQAAEANETTTVEAEVTEETPSADASAESGQSSGGDAAPAAAPAETKAAEDELDF